jgi:hypothetical protein
MSTNDDDEYDDLDDDDSCSEWGGDGWGTLGVDFSNPDPLWNGPDGKLVRCPNCRGSGLAKDMTYW